MCSSRWAASAAARAHDERCANLAVYTRGAAEVVHATVSCHGQRWGMQKASGANRHIFQSVGFKMNNYCECVGVHLWPHMSRCMPGSGYGSPE